jgi:tRNA(Ser,Leu) C12 N-acetylase TAN1
MEIQGHSITDYDLNMSLGGKFKMVMNFSDNLFEYENVINLENVI